MSCAVSIRWVILLFVRSSPDIDCDSVRGTAVKEIADPKVGEEEEVEDKADGQVF